MQSHTQPNDTQPTHTQPQFNIQKWSTLLVEAVNKPGLIMEAYSAFHHYSIGNQMLALVQCQLRYVESENGIRMGHPTVSESQLSKRLPENDDRNSDFTTALETNDDYY